jgi:hypothetical protein
MCSVFAKIILFRFLTSDSISQPQGEGDFAIHYTIEMEGWSFASLFLFVYKCGYLRALTVYVWSEHPCGISLFIHTVVVFVVSSFLFFLLVDGLFSFKFRSSFAPRRVASCFFPCIDEVGLFDLLHYIERSVFRKYGKLICVWP